MSTAYELLFAFLGSPINRLIAGFSQRVEWNLSSTLIHLVIIILIFSTITVAVILLRKKSDKKKINSITTRFCVLLIFFSILYLWYSAASQNSLTPYLIPCYHRESLSARFDTHRLEVPEKFIKWRNEKAIEQFKKEFDWQQYSNLNYQSLVEEAQRSIIKSVHEFGYSTGAEILKLKTLTGLPRILGYSYGGPAYYDSATHEVILPDPTDYPASKYFFVSTLFHELAHAHAFQNELDASLVQYHAMKSSKYSTIRAFAEFMWLEYSGALVSKNYIQYLIDNGIDRRFLTDIKESRLKVRQHMLQIRLVEMLTRSMQSINLYNDSHKYGWNPQQFSTSPFYQVIYKWEYTSWIKDEVIK